MLHIMKLKLYHSKNLKQLNDELMKKNDLYKKISCSPAKKPLTPKKKLQIKKKLTQTDSPNNKLTDKNPSPSMSNQIPSHHITTSKTTQVSSKNSRICILSSNKRNNIRSIAEDTLTEQTTICHYLMPHCKTEKLIYNIEAKLLDFTMNDFCVILLGEEDFATTNDYFSLIYEIRATLEKVKHTNVIICTPTFKNSYYVNLFNFRVENFNNLIYLDILEHEHAYLLDSNKNLTYDYKSFDRRTGRITNTGMRIIFNDIKEYINAIKYETTENDNECQSLLFLYYIPHNITSKHCRTSK